MRIDPSLALARLQVRLVHIGGWRIVALRRSCLDFHRIQPERPLYDGLQLVTLLFGPHRAFASWLRIFV